MGQETGRPDGEERAQESSQWTEPQAGDQDRPDADYDDRGYG